MTRGLLNPLLTELMNLCRRYGCVPGVVSLIFEAPEESAEQSAYTFSPLAPEDALAEAERVAKEMRRPRDSVERVPVEPALGPHEFSEDVPFSPTQQYAQGLLQQFEARFPDADVMMLVSRGQAFEVCSNQDADRDLALCERVRTVLPRYEQALRENHRGKS